MSNGNIIRTHSHIWYCFSLNVKWYISIIWQNIFIFRIHDFSFHFHLLFPIHFLNPFWMDLCFVAIVVYSFSQLSSQPICLLFYMKWHVLIVQMPFYHTKMRKRNIFFFFWILITEFGNMWVHIHDIIIFLWTCVSVTHSRNHSM